MPRKSPKRLPFGLENSFRIRLTEALLITASRRKISAGITEHLDQLRQRGFKVNTVPWLVRVFKCNFDRFCSIVGGNLKGFFGGDALYESADADAGKNITGAMEGSVNAIVLIDKGFACDGIQTIDAGLALRQGDSCKDNGF